MEGRVALEAAAGAASKPVPAGSAVGVEAGYLRVAVAGLVVVAAAGGSLAISRDLVVVAQRQEEPAAAVPEWAAPFLS